MFLVNHSIVRSLYQLFDCLFKSTLAHNIGLVMTFKLTLWITQKITSKIEVYSGVILDCVSFMILSKFFSSAYLTSKSKTTSYFSDWALRWGCWRRTWKQIDAFSWLERNASAFYVASFGLTNCEADLFFLCDTELFVSIL